MQVKVDCNDKLKFVKLEDQPNASGKVFTDERNNLVIQDDIGNRTVFNATAWRAYQVLK